MLAREEEGKEFGVIVMAEGLAEFLPGKHLKASRDEHGHIAIPQVNLCRLFSELIAEGIQSRTGQAAQDHRRCNWATKAAAPRRRPSTSCSAASSASGPIGRWSKSGWTA